MGQFFAVFATDHPDSLALRQRLRPSHQAHLRSTERHRVIVRLGGPTLDDASAAMNGTLLVIEAGSLPEVEAFIQDDPYVQAGLFASIQIRPWHWSLGNPNCAADPMTTITLCQLDDIADGGALGLPQHRQLHPAGLIAVRQGDQAWVYINRCPHFSVPLDYRPQEFCTYRGKVLMCAHHSAMFRFEDGHCIDGPCKGAQLEAVPVRRVENRLLLEVAEEG